MKHKWDALIIEQSFKEYFKVFKKKSFLFF